jgi:hypothetical protein
MVPHARAPLDDGSHTGQRPQIGAETVGARPLEKPVFDLRKLLAMELGLATGATGGTQRSPTAPLPGLVPAADTLAARVQRPRHKSQFLTDAEKLRCLQAALFQRLEISSRTHSWSHASTIHERVGVVTLFCEIQ